MREDTIIIDGIRYDVPVKEFHPRGSFLHKYAERTNDGKLRMELIGYYENAEIVFVSGYRNPDAYRALWNKITEPVELHDITVWDVNGVRTFRGYFAEPRMEMVRIKNGVAYWKNMSVSVVCDAPTRKKT